METVFVLRVCSPDLTSHKGFQWPSTIGAKVTWLFREVPADVIAWFEALPDTDITPAWV